MRDWTVYAIANDNVRNLEKFLMDLLESVDPRLKLNVIGWELGLCGTNSLVALLLRRI